MVMSNQGKWKVVVLDDEGSWQILATDLTYEKADELIDNYTEEHPFAMVDMLEVPPEINLTP
jgi:hypothetical protein